MTIKAPHVSFFVAFLCFVVDSEPVCLPFPPPRQDDRLTVTQATPVGGRPSLLRFHYQLTERRSAFWDTALSGDSLFLEIPAGSLAEGSKEGYV